MYVPLCQARRATAEGRGEGGERVVRDARERELRVSASGASPSGTSAGAQPPTRAPRQVVA